MRTLCAAFILFLFAHVCFSQCPFNKPEWADNGTISLSNSIVRPFYAKGRSLKEAQDDVERQKREERARLVAQRVNISSSAANYSSNFDYSAVNLAEYSEKCGEEYFYWQLAQIVINSGISAIPEKVSFTDKYAVSEVRGRIFVPGMAQFYKGSTGKGAAFIIGEVAFVGGIVGAECVRQAAINRINATHDATLRTTYTRRANNAALVRNVSIAGAVAVYAWNVIDGIVARGKRHVFVGDNWQMDFAPYADGQSGGLAVHIAF